MKGRYAVKVVGKGDCLVDGYVRGEEGFLEYLLDRGCITGTRKTRIIDHRHWLYGNNC